MSGEEQNRGFYRETFEEIFVPEGLAEKVGRIIEGEGKRKRTVAKSVMRKVAMAAAILAALFVGSNGIAYAMTGDTWVKTMILRRNINETEYEVEAQEHHLRNGETVYVGEVEIEVEDGVITQIIEHDGNWMYMEVESGDAELWSSDDKSYIWDEDLEIDITEDLADDGHASGIYEVNGVWKGYAVKRTDEKLSCYMEILEEGIGPDWKTNWTIRKYVGDKIEMYEALLSSTPVPEP